MELLTEREENCLKFLLNRKNNIGFGNEDTIKLEEIDDELFDFSHFSSLKNKGYITARVFDDQIDYYLNSSSLDYFDEKEKQIIKETENKKLATKRFWLDKIIPFLALIISLFSLFNYIFHWFGV